MEKNLIQIEHHSSWGYILIEKNRKFTIPLWCRTKKKAGQEKIPGVELDENKNIINYDIETQCHSVFQNIKYILEDAGSSWENIVDVQVFLTNMKDDFKIYNKIYTEYFKENQP